MYYLNLTFSILLSFISSTQSIELYCPLTWVDYAIGDGVPARAVPATPGQFYIARVFDPVSNKHKIGGMELMTGLAHIDQDVYAEFQLLTNPYECIVEWSAGGGAFKRWTPLHSVPVGSSGNVSTLEYVGRTLIGIVLLPGSVNTLRGRIHIGSDSTMQRLFRNLRSYPTQLPNYQILRSYSNGLHEEIHDLVIKSNLPSNNLDFLGMDEIQNNADVELKLNVTHSKLVRESIIFSRSTSTYFSFVAHAPLPTFPPLPTLPPRPTLPPVPPIPSDHAGKTAHYESSISPNALEPPLVAWKDSVTKETFTETFVSVSREITVPPRTSIQTCSAVALSLSLDSEFSATSTFTGRGLSGEQVYRLLKLANPEFDGEVVGNSVKAQTFGKVTAKQAVATRFIVLPADSMQNCKLLAKTAARQAKEWDLQWRNAVARYHEEERYDEDSSSIFDIFPPESFEDTRNTGLPLTDDTYLTLKESMKPSEF